MVSYNAPYHLPWLVWVVHGIVFIWDFNTIAWCNSEPVKQKKKVEESDDSISEGDVSNVAEQEEEEEVEVKKVSRRKENKKRRLVFLIHVLPIFV